jgi:uncharacterized membrane protein YdjX (TVP38/TMEM64 family)
MQRRTVVKIALALVLIAAVAAIYASPLRANLSRENVRGAVEHLRGLWYGPLVFIAAYAVGCVFAIPASVFVLSAGVIWGWLLGAAYSMVGGLLGATASFYLARFIGEGLLDRFGRVGRMVAKQVDHAGFKSLLVLRFVPGIPFAVLNYGAGVAAVRTQDFLLATIIGMAPSKFVFAYCADALFNGTMSEGDALKRMLIVGGLMIALAFLPNLVKRLARGREAAATE